MRALVLVLLAGLLAIACGDDEGRSPAAAQSAAPGMTRYVDERRGFEVTFPSDWQRARRVLTPTLIEPREILSVGTVEPVANHESSACAQHPLRTLARVGSRDVFVTIQERTNHVSRAMADGPPQLAGTRADDGELPACLKRPVRFKTYWVRFRSGARDFYAHAAIGDRVPREGVAQLQDVLDSLVFHHRRVDHALGSLGGFETAAQGE